MLRLMTAGVYTMLLTIPFAAAEQSGQSNLTCTEMENFLRAAKIGAMKNIPVGITRPKMAPLDDGKMRHEAAIQSIHETRSGPQPQSAAEVKDWWQFNVAAYELAKLLDLNMVPPYVERKLADRPASFSWWIDGAMTEIERVQRKMQPPDADRWAKEVCVAVVFRQLIADGSTHLTNYLIDRNWRLWMIDFTQAFSPGKEIPNRKSLTRCDRRLLANLRSLKKEMLEARLGRYLTARETDALLARRDKIVKFFDEELAKKPDTEVLFNLPRVGERCGQGL